MRSLRIWNCPSSLSSLCYLMSFLTCRFQPPFLEAGSFVSPSSGRVFMKCSEQCLTCQDPGSFLHRGDFPFPSRHSLDFLCGKQQVEEGSGEEREALELSRNGWVGFWEQPSSSVPRHLTQWRDSHTVKAEKCGGALLFFFSVDS